MNKNRGDKLTNDLKIAKKKIFSAVASCTYNINFKGNYISRVEIITRNVDTSWQ